MQQPSIRVDRIGEEGLPVVVVENFSPHPERLIEDAATREFRIMGPYYPGVRAAVPPIYFEGLAAVLTPVMSEVFGAGRSIDFDRALYSLATTRPAELNLAQRIPHIDGVEAGRVAIIHYLSRENLGGTAFFRHRTTGFESITAERHRGYLESLRQDFERYGEPSAAYIAGDTPIFKQTAAYEPAFNRALIYRGNLLHCATIPQRNALSADAIAGRLTVASFLSVA